VRGLSADFDRNLAVLETKFLSDEYSRETTTAERFDEFESSNLIPDSRPLNIVGLWCQNSLEPARHFLQGFFEDERIKQLRSHFWKTLCKVCRRQFFACTLSFFEFCDGNFDDSTRCIQQLRIPS
jgi:hypothetical protein